MGTLFTGFMLTPSGPKVLEYNVRFGDPETEALMVLLGDDVDLVELLLVSQIVAKNSLMLLTQYRHSRPALNTVSIQCPLASKKVSPLQ